jgi:hypothetical protein
MAERVFDLVLFELYGIPGNNGAGVLGDETDFIGNRNVNFP